DSNLPVYEYMVSHIEKSHAIPLSIPQINNNMSVLGDPLNSFFNPLFGLSILAFGINIGLRVTILLCCFVSGITMYFLLKKFSKEKIIWLFGSFLYMSGGAFFASVASGHIEKFLVYPIIPLLLFWGINKKLLVRQMLGLGFVVIWTIYSGDLYATWFCILMYTVIRGYFFFTQKQKKQQLIFFILPLCIAIVLALPKIVPFVQQVLPFMEKSGEVNAFKGSLPWYYFPVPFIEPFGVWFWDRPFFQRHLGFYYNWYEYFAFITPIPFIFLIKVKKIFSKEIFKAIMLLLTLGTLYFSLSFWYSPFFWVFHFSVLQDFFRVPQRIVMPMTTVVVLLLSLCTEEWLRMGKRRLVILVFVVSLFWTLAVDWQILSTTFPKNDSLRRNMIAQFAQKYKKVTVVNFATQVQYFLIQKNMRVDNYYYGWYAKNSILYTKNGKINLSALVAKKPEFIVTNTYKKMPIPIGYTKLMGNTEIVIWRRI
ncbi:MAG TPA: hypothetical protein VLB73_02030, partial [Patescibacteria group bacterium]|nr:hypothetical protein [Patescibacteria group bacterium]